MKKTFYIFFALMLLTSLSALKLKVDEKKLMEEEARSFCVYSAYNLSQPLLGFDKNYESDIAFSVGIGSRYFIKEKKVFGFSFPRKKEMVFVEYSNFKFNTRSSIALEEKSANLNLFSFGSQEYLPLTSFLSLSHGESSGAAKFVLDEDYFDIINTTGTELGIENDEWQFASTERFGLNLTLFKNFNIEPAYEEVVVEKEFKVFKNQLSLMIKRGITSLMTLYLHKDDKAFEVSDTAKNLMIFGVALGTNVLWYELDKESHSWPFDYAQPLRLRNYKVGFSVDVF